MATWQITEDEDFIFDSKVFENQNIISEVFVAASLTIRKQMVRTNLDAPKKFFIESA